MNIAKLLRGNTIRWRLTIIFASNAILILLFAGSFIFTFSANFRKNEFKLRLQHRLEEFQRIMREQPNGPLPEFSQYDESVMPREQLEMFALSDTIKILSPEGNLTIAKKDIIDDAEPNYFRVGRRDIAVIQDDVLQHFLIVSAVDVYGYTKMGNLQKVIITCMICSVLMLAFVSWYWTRRMLEPIAAKIKKARLIRASSLDLRLEVNNPADELGMLAQTFNQMLDRLEKGFKTQQQFIGNASHELRAPLTVLRTEAEWALHRQRSTEEYQEVLGKVLDKSRQLGQLVDRLLILARLEGSQMATDLQKFRIDELLLQTVEEVREEQSLASIQCNIETNTDASYLMQGDSGMIQTALTNLLDNALKYGLGQPITVTLSANEAYYCITVQDKGIGIGSAEMEQIFEPFFRSAKAQNIAKGTGLGLTLVQEVAQWHGGRLKAKSVTGDTTFSLFLPKYQ